MPLSLTLWALALVVLVWWGPGWLIGEALGVRRILLPAAAPVIGIGALSTIGVLGRSVGLPWAPLPVLAVLLALSGLIYLARTLVLRRRTERATVLSPDGEAPDVQPMTRREQRTPMGAAEGVVGPESPQRFGWILAAGLIAGGVIGAITWVKSSAMLAGINQDWDIPWHANMVRLIAESRLWDPSVAGHFAYYDTVIAEAPIRSYPIAFHAAVALVWPLSGVSIPVFLNVVVLVLVAVQVPISAMTLTALLSRHPVALASAAAVSTWLAVYPYDLLWRGPLIPFVAGLVLIGPFLLLTTTGALRREWWWTPAVALGAVGIIAIHPSLAFVVLPLLLFWLLGTTIVNRGRVLAIVGYLVASGGLALVIGFPIIKGMLGEAGRVSDVRWAADTDLPGALDNALWLHHGTMPVPIVTAMVLVGLVAIIVRPRTWWYLGPLALFGLLSVYTMGTDNESFLMLTAPFYDDQWRVFGVFVMLVVPIAGLGIFQGSTTIALVSQRLVSQRLVSGRRAGAGRGTATTLARRDRQVRLTASVAAVIVFVAGVASVPYFKENVNRVSPSTVVAGPTLSAGEVRLMSEISQWVPDDATVLNDSCDGSVWMYALGDRMPMIRHFEVLPTNRQLALWDGFPRLAEDPAIREAAAQMGIEWVYVADGRIREWDAPKPGLESLDQLSFLTLVAREDNASLYQIDWAELPDGEALLEKYSADLLRQPGVAGVWENANPDGIAPLGSIC